MDTEDKFRVNPNSDLIIPFKELKIPLAALKVSHLDQNVNMKEIISHFQEYYQNILKELGYRNHLFL